MSKVGDCVVICVDGVIIALRDLRFVVVAGRAVFAFVVTGRVFFVIAAERAEIVERAERDC